LRLVWVILYYMHQYLNYCYNWMKLRKYQ